MDRELQPPDLPLDGQGLGAHPGSGTEVGVGANGSVWIVGTNPVGFRAFTTAAGNGWTPIAGGAVSIAVDPSGHPWIINSAHQIYSS